MVCHTPNTRQIIPLTSRSSDHHCTVKIIQQIVQINPSQHPSYNITSISPHCKYLLHHYQGNHFMSTNCISIN